MRPTMSELVQQLRLLIGDPAGDQQTFTDEELQTFLDARRADHRYRRLRALYSIEQGLSVSILAYSSGPLTDWEADAALFGPDFARLQPSTSDWHSGIWTFAIHQPEPVRIVGRTYDLAGSAADVLETWAARLKGEYDLRTSDYEFQRMDRIEAMIRLAGALRARQKPRRLAWHRSDMDDGF